MTAPQRTASTNAARMFGSSKASAVIVSGKPLVWGDGLPDLKFPHHRQLGAELVLLQGLQGHHVSEAWLALVGRAAWKPLRDHVGDRPVGAAHADDLATFR